MRRTVRCARESAFPPVTAESVVSDEVYPVDGQTDALAVGEQD
jgi:hypothetical protein